MPKLTIDGKEVEVAAGTNLIEAARQAGVEVPHYCYHPGLSIAGQCRLCMVDIEKNPRPQIGCNTQAADGMVVHTQTERVLETRKSIMEFHLVNHPLDCPVCDQAGRVLAADLLHASRPLRPAHGRREGPQAEGGAARSPRHPGRGALHPLLALRALLRRGDQDRRARDLQPRRPLRDRPLPGQDPREQLLGQRHRHLPGGGADRPRLPLPGPGVVPRHRPLDLQRVRARLQRRGAHEPPPAPPQPGAPHRAPQAAPQPRRQPVVDVRRRSLRVRMDRRRQPAARAPAPGRRRGRGARLGRGGGGAGRGGQALSARGDRHPRLAPDVERGPLRAAAPRRPARAWPRSITGCRRGCRARRTTSSCARTRTRTAGARS